jgi:hypothetical protein
MYRSDPCSDGKCERIESYALNLLEAEHPGNAGSYRIKEAHAAPIVAHAQLICSSVVTIISQKNEPIIGLHICRPSR